MESQIVQLDNEQLDKLFGEQPEVKLDAGGEKSNNPTEEKNIVIGGSEIFSEIPLLPEDAFTEDNGEAAENKDGDGAAENKDGDEAAENKDGDEAAENKDGKSTKSVVKEKKAEEHNIETSGVSEVLKNTVEYLVSNGLWSDFEGRESLEITQDVYAELAIKQNEHKVSEMFNELVDQTGDYGKAIIGHIKAGGNPDDIIDLFKEQKEIDRIDTSSEEGKQSLIERYYSDVLNWKPEKVKKTVNRLITDNEIDSEFEEVRDLYDRHYSDKLEEIREKGKEQERKRLENQQRFISDIKSALSEDTGIPDKEKPLIAQSILNFKHQLENGQKVNDFYVKFAEMQADPKKYIKLVRFVMNPEGFEKQIAAKQKTEASKEVFSFIKGNAAVSKAKNPQISISDSSAPSSTKKGTDFSFILKK